MNYELINSRNTDYTITQQILANRGIAFEDIDHYLNVSESDNLPCTLLNNIEEAARMLVKNLSKEGIIKVQVDKQYCPL